MAKVVRCVKVVVESNFNYLVIWQKPVKHLKHLKKNVSTKCLRNKFCNTCCMCFISTLHQRLRRNIRAFERTWLLDTNRRQNRLIFVGIFGAKLLWCTKFEYKSLFFRVLVYIENKGDGLLKWTCISSNSY